MCIKETYRIFWLELAVKVELKIGLIIFGLLFASLSSAKGNLNSKVRNTAIDAIVLHAIAGPYCNKGIVRYSSAKSGLVFWKGFFERHAVVGIHYIIDRDGSIVSSIDEGRVANHAIGWNQRSIGVELINKGDGVESYPKAQILSLELLVRQLMVKYPKIKLENIVRHSDIDARSFVCGSQSIKQKQDPGQEFGYRRFLKALADR